MEGLIPSGSEEPNDGDDAEEDEEEIDPANAVPNYPEDQRADRFVVS